MRKLILALFFMLNIVVTVSAQSFPQRCNGKWTGTMQIFQKGNLVDSVGIVFTVTPFGGEAGFWFWNTEYISDRMPMTKNYTLIEKQDCPNEFLLDEGDGVILTNYVFGNKMYSVFKTGKTWLTASYEFVSENLIFEVTSGVVSKEKTKGVTNYTVDFLQRVVLTKIT